MKSIALGTFSICLLIVLSTMASASDVQLTGELRAEFRYFPDEGAYPGLSDRNSSVAVEFETFTPLEGRDSFRVTGFARWDENDDERTHVDFREFKWHKVERDWELTLGVDQVFWGVTETVHLVNIINQTDFVESPDGEEFFGQPMAKLSFIRDWGDIDLFVLPGFRERSFPGEGGRPGSGFRVSTDDVIYESGSKENHVDAAMRWSASVASWDLGVSYFYGTSREPRFDIDDITITDDGLVEFVPIYDIIHQTSVDVQSTFDAWLWKLEAIYRRGWGDDFFASAAGFEYTFFDVGRSGFDVGVISEYLYDERDDQVVTENDVSLGVRLALNDINSTEFLAAFVQDLDRDSNYFYVEASRRIGNQFTLSVEARGVGQVEASDFLQVYEQDDFLQLELSWFF